MGGIFVKESSKRSVVVDVNLIFLLIFCLSFVLVKKKKLLMLTKCCFNCSLSEMDGQWTSICTAKVSNTYTFGRMDERGKTRQKMGDERRVLKNDGFDNS